ncbi:glycoside hydrolase domain-containing protein [Bacteroidota bacterium]
MKKTVVIIYLSVLPLISYSQEILKVDPNHSQDGGYGYLINSDQTCSVWWAEGSYKVMRDAPLPSQKDNQVKIWSAKNEYESFIVVIHPENRMENFRITMPELTDNQGNTIGPEKITVRKVAYVKVTKPTDSYGYTGWWPDPLPVYDAPETVFPKENQPFWITVKVPASAKAGNYSGNLVLSSGAWNLTVPVNLRVWDFTLPESPSMRSGLGMSMNNVKDYDNINTLEEEKKVFEYYMETFRDYKISPYNPFEYSPIKEEVRGVAWEGGLFDSEVKHAGTYSYKLVDESATENTEGHTKYLIPVNNVDSYQLSWHSKSLIDKQDYVIGVECYNAEKELVIYENRFNVFSVNGNWAANTLDLDKFSNEIRFVKIRLFPSKRTLTGEHKGTVWFDNISLINTVSEQNEFTAGNFEVNLGDIDIQLDFADFNVAGKRYLDEFGFTGYRLRLKGLGGGNYYSRRKGVFEGFEQGTDEYNKLMEGYLSQMQSNLEKQGWIGKEYIYWFDEPGEKDYPFVKETNALIKKYAPKITTFLTEHVAGQDISDVTDISCTIWHKLDHDKIKNMNKNGLEHWSYLCCWPKSPWISEFIDHDAINLRMWLWASYQHQLKGILIWQTTYWDSNAASPEGYLQNPWEQAMSFVRGYGWPLGKQTIWGNGDGRFFYPVNRDPNNDTKTYIEKPVPSIRLEILRDGIEDYEYFVMLEEAVKTATGKKKKIAKEADDMLNIPETIYTNETTYSKNPQEILNYRKQLAEYILELQ